MRWRMCSSAGLVLLGTVLAPPSRAGTIDFNVDWLLRMRGDLNTAQATDDWRYVSGNWAVDGFLHAIAGGNNNNTYRVFGSFPLTSLPGTVTHIDLILDSVTGSFRLTQIQNETWKSRSWTGWSGTTGAAGSYTPFFYYNTSDVAGTDAGISGGPWQGDDNYKSDPGTTGLGGWVGANSVSVSGSGTFDATPWKTLWWDGAGNLLNANAHGAGSGTERYDFLAWIPGTSASASATMDTTPILRVTFADTVATPEPSSLTLCLGGLIGLAVLAVSATRQQR